MVFSGKEGIHWYFLFSSNKAVNKGMYFKTKVKTAKPIENYNLICY
jgi:hypothetical protein